MTPRTLVVPAVLALVLVVVGGPAAAFEAPGPRWPGSTIRFHETLPKSYDWSLKKAVRAWNTSGARVKLRKVNKRSRAQVKVGFGNTYGNGGYASIGRQPGAYLRLGGRGPLDVENRATASALIAHEFGHVLGLNHTAEGKCRLMESLIKSECLDGPVGYYKCTWLSKDDVRGVLRLYGGRAKKPKKKYCLIEPKPPGVAGVRVSAGGPRGPIAVQWDPPGKARKGSHIRVGIYAPERCSGDESAPGLAFDEVSTQTGRWTEDSNSVWPGEYCVEVQVVNRYGLGGKVTRVPFTLQRATGPAPVIGDLFEYPAGEWADYLVEARIPEDASLLVAVAPPGQCANHGGGRTSECRKGGRRTVVALRGS